MPGRGRGDYTEEPAIALSQYACGGATTELTRTHMHACNTAQFLSERFGDLGPKNGADGILVDAIRGLAVTRPQRALHVTPL
jgi:hypothetical protein